MVDDNPYLKRLLRNNFSGLMAYILFDISFTLIVFTPAQSDSNEETSKIMFEVPELVKYGENGSTTSTQVAPVLQTV